MATTENIILSPDSVNLIEIGSNTSIHITNNGDVPIWYSYTDGELGHDLNPSSSISGVTEDIYITCSSYGTVIAVTKF